MMKLLHIFCFLFFISIIYSTAACEGNTYERSKLFTSLDVNTMTIYANFFVNNDSADDIKNAPLLIRVVEPQSGTTLNVKRIYTNDVGTATYTINPDLCADYYVMYCPHDDEFSPEIFPRCTEAMFDEVIAEPSDVDLVGSLPAEEQEPKYILQALSQSSYCPPPPPVVPAFCLPLFAIFALLGGAMYMSGQNPLRGFDLTTPRMRVLGGRYVARGGGFGLAVFDWASSAVSSVQGASSELKSIQRGEGVTSWKSFKKAVSNSLERAGKKITRSGDVKQDRADASKNITTIRMAHAGKVYNSQTKQYEKVNPKDAAPKAGDVLSTVGGGLLRSTRYGGLAGIGAVVESISEGLGIAEAMDKKDVEAGKKLEGTTVTTEDGRSYELRVNSDGKLEVRLVTEAGVGEWMSTDKLAIADPQLAKIISSLGVSIDTIPFAENKSLLEADNRQVIIVKDEQGREVMMVQDEKGNWVRLDKSDLTFAQQQTVTSEVAGIQIEATNALVRIEHRAAMEKAEKAIDSDKLVAAREYVEDKVEAEKKKEGLGTEIQKKEGEVKELEVKLEQVEAGIKENEAKIEKLQAKLDAAKTDPEKATLQQQITDLKAEGASERASIQSDISELRSDIRDAKRDIIQIGNEITAQGQAVAKEHGFDLNALNSNDATQYVAAITSQYEQAGTDVSFQVTGKGGTTAIASTQAQGTVNEAEVLKNEMGLIALVDPSVKGSPTGEAFKEANQHFDNSQRLQASALAFTMIKSSIDDMRVGYLEIKDDPKTTPEKLQEVESKMNLVVAVAREMENVSMPESRNCVAIPSTLPVGTTIDDGTKVVYRDKDGRTVEGTYGDLKHLASQGDLYVSAGTEVGKKIFEAFSEPVKTVPIQVPPVVEPGGGAVLLSQFAKGFSEGDVTLPSFLTRNYVEAPHGTQIAEGTVVIVKDPVTGQTSHGKYIESQMQGKQIFVPLGADTGERFERVISDPTSLKLETFKDLAQHFKINEKSYFLSQELPSEQRQKYLDTTANEGVSLVLQKERAGDPSLAPVTSARDFYNTYVSQLIDEGKVGKDLPKPPPELNPNQEYVKVTKKALEGVAGDTPIGAIPVVYGTRSGTELEFQRGYYQKGAEVGSGESIYVPADFASKHGIKTKEEPVTVNTYSVPLHESAGTMIPDPDSGNDVPIDFLRKKLTTELYQQANNLLSHNPENPEEHSVWHDIFVYSSKENYYDKARGELEKTGLYTKDEINSKLDKAYNEFELMKRLVEPSKFPSNPSTTQLLSDVRALRDASAEGVIKKAEDKLKRVVEEQRIRDTMGDYPTAGTTKKPGRGRKTGDDSTVV